MAINVFVVKKNAVLLLLPMIVCIMYAVGNMFYGLIGGLLFMAGGLLIAWALGTAMLSDPFRKMVEGKGIIVFNIDSTGVINPFIVRVAPPFITGTFMKRDVHDTFDRSAVFNLAAPKEIKKPVEFKENGGIKIDLTEEQYNRGRFALFHMPALIYNSNISSIITKDFLSDTEKEVFAEHTVLYLNRKMEELTSAIRDFGRHIVETLKPGKGLLQNKWVWIILVIAFVILGLLFIKPIIAAIQNFGGNTVQAVGTASGGNIFNAR